VKKEKKMSRKIVEFMIAGVLVLLLASVSTPDRAEEPQPKMWYGYYVYGPYREAGTDISDYIEKTSDYTNLITIPVTDAIPSDAQMRSIEQKGCWALLSVEYMIYDGFNNPEREKRELQKIRDWVKNHIDRIYAIYLMDEPYTKGLSKEQLKEKIAIAKEVFPDVPIMVNFDFSTLEGRGYPSNLDIISHHSYAYLHRGERYYKDAIRKRFALAKRYAGERPIFFIPSSAMNSDWGARDANPDQAWWAYELFKEMNLAGLRWWFYDERGRYPEQGWFYGYLHLQVQDELGPIHRKVGQEIKSQR